MPKIEFDTRTIVASLGGGALFSEAKTLSPFARDYLPDLIRSQLHQNHAVIAIIGGGPEARARIAAARANNENISQFTLDEIGIQVTTENARFIADWLMNDYDVPVRLYTFKQPLTRGVVFIGHGTEPGHNTDYVAVQAALEAGQGVLLNISNQPGLLRIVEGTASDEIILDISWTDFLRIAPTHYAGIQHPFPKEAAELAMKNDMTVVLLGSDIANTKRCINNEEFVGTVIHP